MTAATAIVIALLGPPAAYLGARLGDVTWELRRRRARDLPRAQVRR